MGPTPWPWEVLRNLSKQLINGDHLTCCCKMKMATFTSRQERLKVFQAQGASLVSFWLWQLPEGVQSTRERTQNHRSSVLPSVESRSPQDPEEPPRFSCVPKGNKSHFCLPKMIYSSTTLLKAWSLNTQHQHYLEIYQNANSWAPPRPTKSETCGVVSSVICVLTNPPLKVWGPLFY